MKLKFGRCTRKAEHTKSTVYTVVRKHLEVGNSRCGCRLPAFVRFCGIVNILPDLGLSFCVDYCFVVVISILDGIIGLVSDGVAAASVKVLETLSHKDNEGTHGYARPPDLFKRDTEATERTMK